MGVKGSQFERTICKFLSRWWTQDLKKPREDIFWRTQTSGARATTRAKRGYTTHGQHSDIAATDPKGKPLTRSITFELKTGYSRESSGAMDLIDYMDGKRTKLPSLLEQFYLQVTTAQKLAKTKYWMIITKRVGKKELVYFPQLLLDELIRCGAFRKLPYPTMQIRCRVRLQTVPKVKKVRRKIVVMLMKDFFRKVTPEHIKLVYKGKGQPK